MSWYDEERDGPYKNYLEWCWGFELEPDEEAGFYKIKRTESERSEEP